MRPFVIAQRCAEHPATRPAPRQSAEAHMIAIAFIVVGLVSFGIGVSFGQWWEETRWER